MAEEMLPLFPLQVVLFPESHLPLHIFEDRYKVLIGECRTGNREFGINLMHENALSWVGCTAQVTDVLHEYGDGRLDIVVQGRRRYKVLRHESVSKPYLVGTVRFLEGIREEVEGGLVRETIGLYNRLVAVVYKGKVQEIDGAAVRRDLSFAMAQKAGLDLLARQRLLEIDSESERLLVLREYFLEVLPRLEKLEEVERIVKSDGYL